jgi:plastocyanin
MRLRHSTVLGGLAIVVALAAPALAATYHVQIMLTQFDPAELTVNVGDTVEWNNNSFLQHTVTSGNSCSSNGIFNSGLMDPAAVFSYTFNSGGAFPYFCTLHCLAGMRGTITVNAPVAVRPTTWGGIKALYAAAQR